MEAAAAIDGRSPAWDVAGIVGVLAGSSVSLVCANEYPDELHLEVWLLVETVSRLESAVDGGYTSGLHVCGCMFVGQLSLNVAELGPPF
jgi:hypothetical protein